MTTTRDIPGAVASRGGRVADGLGGGGGPLGPPSAGSVRFRLAHVARLTALGTPGVVDLDAGPEGRFATVDGAQRLDGVMCVAVGEAGYEVSLRLVCGLIPLTALAQSVRSRLTAAAAGIGLPLAVVHVHVVNVREPRVDIDRTAAVPRSDAVA